MIKHGILGVLYCVPQSWTKPLNRNLTPVEGWNSLNAMLDPDWAWDWARCAGFQICARLARNRSARFLLVKTVLNWTFFNHSGNALRGKWPVACFAVGFVAGKHRRKVRKALPALPTTKVRPTVDLSPKLQSFLETVETGGSSAPGKGGNVSLEGIARAEAVWKRLRTRALQHNRGETLDPAPEVVKRLNCGGRKVPMNSQFFDVVVCGGTLGILVARALQNQGFAVCIVKRGVVQGRDQEWNVSWEELRPLVRHGIVSQAELDGSVQSSWPKSRVGFESSHHGVEFRAGALNAGISPQKLVEAARRCFEEAGGTIIERTSLQAMEIYDDGVFLRLQDEEAIGARLVVDAMGAGSPIVQQARKGAPPDAACLVVGTMASGYPKEANVDGDYLYSAAEGSLGHQGFWEAFPSENGGVDGTERTTYYFTYVLPGEENLPSIPDVFEEYVEALPGYQQCSLEKLRVKRALCASFVAFRDSPLQTPFDRILQVGDAAGIQSPLSFGGFGALCRHLPRLESAISEALRHDLLSSEHLSQINPYFPNLAMQWSMYRSIAKPPEGEPEFVNRMMGGILSAAERCGPNVMMPILQDVFTLSALGPTLASWMARDPLIIPLFVKSMGPENVPGWICVFAAAFFPYWHYLTLFQQAWSVWNLWTRNPDRLRTETLSVHCWFGWEFCSLLIC